MTTKRRYSIALVFAVMILFSLACTLGGEAAPTATETAVAQITSAPTVIPPTISGPTDTPSPTEVPTDTPTPTATPIVGSGPGGCVLKGAYIADVTIPDGTVLAPNAAFVKTWRIRNDGTCAWDAGYQLVYAEGNQMSGPAAVNIPSAAAGQTIDVSVNLVAPGATGDFTGKWRLRASNNAIFGGYTVVIKVVGTPTPTPSPTATPTLTGGGVWGGAWETTYGTMNLVQSGSSVTGFYGTSATINGTVAGNRLSGTWTEGGSSGSFDFWIGNDGKRWHGNWNKTQAWCGHRAGETDFTPCGIATWYGTWTTSCEGSVPCGDMVLTQGGGFIEGTYAGTSGKINGTVNGTVMEGTWTRNPGSPSQTSGTFKFFMLPDGTQFQGNYNTTFYWCGHRGGASDPSPCLKN